MSPGSPGFSRFLLSPGRASVASNIVKPGEYTITYTLWYSSATIIVLTNGQASTLKTTTKSKQKIDKKKNHPVKTQ